MSVVVTSDFADKMGEYTALFVHRLYHSTHPTIITTTTPIPTLRRLFDFLPILFTQNQCLDPLCSDYDLVVACARLYAKIDCKIGVLAACKSC